MSQTAALAVLVVSTAAFAQSPATPAAHWQGKLLIPDHEMSVTLDLAQNAKGAWIGSISVLGSTSIDVPLTEIAIDGATVRFAAALPQRATFTAQLSADGATLSGTAANMEGDAPMQFTRSGPPKVKEPAASSPLPKEFEGSWQGAVESGGRTRRVGLKLTAGPGGLAAGTLIAIEQNNLEIPVATVTIKDKQLQLDAPAVSGMYRGTLNGDEIAGELTQGGAKLALTFHRQ